MVSVSHTTNTLLLLLVLVLLTELLLLLMPLVTGLLANAAQSREPAFRERTRSGRHRLVLCLLTHGSPGTSVHQQGRDMRESGRVPSVTESPASRGRLAQGRRQRMSKAQQTVEEAARCPTPCRTALRLCGLPGFGPSSAADEWGGLGHVT